MLKQASVQQVRDQSLPRNEDSLIIVCMAFYPRGLKKELRDAYVSDLAPDRELLQEWKNFEKTAGHEEAFKLSHYEERFSLSERGLFYLKAYSNQSREKDIYFVCQCEIGEKCHREMLMILAQKNFNAVIDRVYKRYPIFEKRLTALGNQNIDP